MFRFDQETDERAEEEHGAPSTPTRYYLTASQVLDPQFTSEDCPPSLRDGDSSAPLDPKQEKELPSKCQWWGKRTMFEQQEAKSQGIRAAITELQLHFKHENILTSRRRTTALEKMIMSGADRQHFLGMVKVREHALNKQLKRLHEQKKARSQDQGCGRAEQQQQLQETLAICERKLQEALAKLKGGESRVMSTLEQERAREGQLRRKVEELTRMIEMMCNEQAKLKEATCKGAKP